MLTEYHEIYQGEIFRKSRCIELENSLMDFFQKNLTLLNYQPVDRSKKIWKRNNKTVVVCLVDDISTCSDNTLNVSELFDSNTVVITDNKIYSPTQYHVLSLPDSFFGIYYYRPENINFDPVKNINLSVNRLDPLRQLILLELISHNPVDDIFKNLNINFNCFMHNGGNYSNAELIDNFKSIAKINDLSRYQTHYCQLLDKIPINTHGSTIELAALDAFVNMVIETYCGKNIVAVSEKIFRALVTATPWTVYSGKHTVSFLKSLGFDVLDDLIDHSYSYKEYSLHGDECLIDYVTHSVQSVEKLKSIPKKQLTERCHVAAINNQNLLASMRQQFPVDFAHWWNNNIQYVA
jgi:hypothetical protein